MFPLLSSDDSFPSLPVSSHTYVDHCSSKDSRVTFCISLKWSSCATFSSLVVFPMNSSYLHLPAFSTISPLLSQRARTTISYPFLHHDPWTLHTITWNNHRSPNLFDWCPETYISAQFSSVTQSYPILCNPMDCSTPGLPVHHQLPEFTQTHIHWVGNAIQPSHPLSSSSPPAFNLSQHQDLFKWVSFLHQVAKV